MMSSARNLFVALLCLCAGAARAGAQPTGTNASPGDSPPAAAPVALQPAAGRSSTVIYLRNEAGDVVPVLNGVTLEEVLELLEQRRQGQRNELPPYSLARISLTGTTSGNQAELQAEIQVQVTRPEAVRVPLKLGEAVLRDMAYEGPGQAAFDALDPATGYSWWFTGVGLHTLKLSLVVPLRQEPPMHRLQLSLPASAVSDLQLTVPGPKVTAHAEDKLRLTVTNREGKSLITALGLGARLDVNWQPQPDLTGVEAVLEARTSLCATLDGETVLLEANQRIVPLQGSFAEVIVRMPAGFELLKLEGSAVREQRALAESAQQILVVLREPASGPVDLKWTLRAEQTAAEGNTVIEGFEVEKARIQTGHLGLRVVGNYRVNALTEESSFVQRVNVGDLGKAVPPIPASGEMNVAYRILRQPFRLGLRLEPVQPYVTVKPTYAVRLSASQMELEATWHFQVFRGAVSDVTLTWPQRQEAQWKVESVEPAERVDQSVLGDPGMGEKISLRFLEGLRGPFTLRLKASRPLSDVSGPVTLTLPTVESSGRQPAEVLLVLADNLEVEVQGGPATVARPLGTSELSVELPRAWRELRRMAYTVESPTISLEAWLSVHKQKLVTQTDVELTRDRDAARVAVVQHFHYDVAYERIGQIRIQVPAAVLEQCRFMTPAGLELLPTQVAQLGPDREVRITLDHPRVGKFEVQAHYRVAAGDQTGSLSIPLLTCLDQPWSSVRARIGAGLVGDVDVVGPTWSRAPELGGWIQANGAVANIPLVWGRRRPGSEPVVAVNKRLVRISLDEQGAVQGRLWCQVRPVGSRVEVVVPDNTRVQGAWWGGMPLVLPSSTAADEEQTYSLSLPGAVDRAGLLTLDWQTATRSLTGLAMHQLELPHIRGDAGVSETAWEISLPATQLLLDAPNTLNPLFHWERLGWLWQRTNVSAPAELQHWIGADRVQMGSPPLSRPEHSYQFSSHGPPTTLRFASLRLSLAVLLGAGTALLLGSVCMSLSVLRHMLFLLLVAFAGSVVLALFPGPTLVLAQPVVLGLLLASISGIIQTIVRRRREVRALTLSAPSGFQLASSHIQRDNLDEGREEAVAAGSLSASTGSL